MCLFVAKSFVPYVATFDFFLGRAPNPSGLIRHAPGEVDRRAARAHSRVGALPCSSCPFACDLSSPDLCLTLHSSLQLAFLVNARARDTLLLSSYGAAFSSEIR